MGYEVIYAPSVGRDLDAIFDFIATSAESFGESPDRAYAKAEIRLVEIETALDALGAVPHQGTLRPHLGTGLRNVTKGRAGIYIEVDDARKTLRINTVFYGGQDHDSRVLLRLLTGHSSNDP